MLYNVVLFSAICYMNQPQVYTGLPPPDPPSRRADPAVSHSTSPLAICFSYGTVYASILHSQFVPPSPLRSVSTSLCSTSASPLCVCAKSLQPRPALCEPMAHSPPGSSVLGHSQARTLEWVAMPSSRGSSQPRDRTQVSSLLQ